MSSCRYMCIYLNIFRRGKVWSYRSFSRHNHQRHAISTKNNILNRNGVTLTVQAFYSTAGKQNLENIDIENVTKIESMTEWWDPDGILMPLHTMNNVRIPLIRNGLENLGILKSDDIKSNRHYLSGIKIIDIGCGAGILTEALARLGADVTGLDPSASLINLAKQHATEQEKMFKSLPNYVNDNIEDYSPKNPEEFDVAVISEVIEHVIDKEKFLETCLKIIKPGGSVFLTTPNRTRASWLCNIIVAEYILRLVPKGVHNWSNFITPTELQQMLQKRRSS